MSKEIERAEPEDFVVHYELLRMQINMVVPLLKRIANMWCNGKDTPGTSANCCCEICDTRKFLYDIGIPSTEWHR